MSVTGVPEGAGQRIWRWKWRVLALIFVVGLTGLVLVMNASQARPPTAPVETPGPKPVTAQADAVPVQQRKLSFQTSGLVKDVLVQAGDTVKAGDVLAQLDTATLDLAVEEATANLTLQKALAAESAEGATQGEIAAAKASLESGRAKLQEIERGSNASELRAAEESVSAANASLASAQAQMKKLADGPTAGDLSEAESAVRAADAKLATSRQQLNDTAARPRAVDVAAAELALEQARNTLWAQQVSRDGTCGSLGRDSNQCRSADTSVAAQETAVKGAVAKLEQAKQPATAEERKAAEEGVLSDEAALIGAQERLNQLKAGPTDAESQQARAQVDQAQANLHSAQAKLDLLKEGPTAADREAARSAFEKAQSDYEKLTRGLSQATIDAAQARIRQAEVTLAKAKLALQDATIRAPFDGVVTQIGLRAGEPAGGTTTALTIADLAALQLETKDLDEINAAKVFVGQTVQVIVPALERRTLTGTVTQLASQPTTSQTGDVSYTATIQLSEPVDGLRWGMTARVEFQPTASNADAR